MFIRCGLDVTALSSAFMIPTAWHATVVALVLAGLFVALVRERIKPDIAALAAVALLLA